MFHLDSITRFDSPTGADPCDGGAGEGLHGEGHVRALPLGAHPPQVPGSEEDGEGLPPLQQVRQFTLHAIFGKNLIIKTICFNRTIKKTNILSFPVSVKVAV
jgi:hypothetical protein